MKKINGIIYYDSKEDAAKYKKYIEETFYHYGKHLYYNMVVRKNCKSCNTVKKLENFYKSSSKSYGVSTYCKECTLKRCREYRSRVKLNSEELGLLLEQKRQEIMKSL